MNARLRIDPSSSTIATLGRFAHYRVMRKLSVRITSRPQQTIRCERLMIQNASAWILHDIMIGGRSQLAQAGDLPGHLFATNAVDAALAIDTAQVGMDIVLTVSNVSKEPRPFYAAMIGHDPNTNARVMLPLSSGIPIEPGGAPDDEEETPGVHVILEINDVLHHVTFGDGHPQHVAMRKIQNSDLSARALEEIDRNLDKRPSATVVTIYAFEPIDPSLDLTKMGDSSKPYPYGLIMFDEAIGAPILTLGAVVHDDKSIEWDPAGFQPEWLATPVEDPKALAT